MLSLHGKVEDEIAESDSKSKLCLSLFVATTAKATLNNVYTQQNKRYDRNTKNRFS